MYVGRPTSRTPKHDGLVPDLGLGEAPNSAPQSRTGVQVSAVMIVMVKVGEMQINVGQL